jgi:soluble lytic murein transglycosylase-like protein
MLSFMIPDVSVENRSHSRGPVLGFDPALSRLDVPFAEEIYEAARRHAVNPHLVAAVIQAESAYRPRAVSRKGACGLMQLMPQTALRFGLRRRSIFDPARNITAGVRYLRWLAERLGDDVERVVAAYNAGEGAVERFGGVPPFAETRLYVQRVVAALSLRSAINPERRLEAP